LVHLGGCFRLIARRWWRASGALGYATRFSVRLGSKAGKQGICEGGYVF
jgi:hypothetical protein